MSAAVPPYPRARHAWYVVGVLTLAYVFSFIDRQILSLLVEPIEADLGISDTRMSLLLGLSFAIFYTLLGIPIARFADASSRRSIIAAGIFLWSLMTVLCGVARTFWQLFLARMGVGVGEAALTPAALAMISDYFPKERLARAIGVFTIGVPAGQGIATLVGAALLPVIAGLGRVQLPALGTLALWQLIFIAVGLPGLLIAALMMTVREPIRRSISGTAAVGSGALPLRTVVAYLLENRRTYLGHFLGMSVLTIMGYGIGSWLPTFFARTYGLAVGSAAFTATLLWLGTIFTLVGSAGVVAGGYLADRLHRRYADGHLRAVLVGIGLLLPGYALFALMPTPALALLLLIPATLGAAIPTSAGAAALMLISPPRMRAQVSALFYFVINLVGLGVGPTAVALLTD